MKEDYSFKMFQRVDNVFAVKSHFCSFLPAKTLLLRDGKSDAGGHGGGLRALRAGGDHQVGRLLRRGLRHCRGRNPRQPRQPGGPHEAQP